MPERETLETDVLIVGAGPAGLAAALRLAQLIRKHNAEIESGERSGTPLSAEHICLLEKGREIGAHLLSGAVMNPRAIRELLADESGEESHGSIPMGCEVVEDRVYFFTESGSWKLPILPPFFHNVGNQLISINRMGRWLGQKVEAAGVTVFNGIAGRDLLTESGRVVGVRTDDKGIDRQGRQKANFEPGIDVRAKLTILAEGSRGSLAKQMFDRIPDNSRSSNPQTYAIGVKELWEVPPGRILPGTVIHSAGYPLKTEQFGGGWLYALPDNLVSVGLVSGLDYRDPGFDPHEAFQRFKLHPFIRRSLEGGRMLKYGAKTIPEGGWYSLPPLVNHGAMLVGDSAGFVNSQRLKGIHLAMKSGMLAAETAYQSLAMDDFSEATLGAYSARVRESWIFKELWPVRNYHQAMQKGLVRGGLHVALQLITGGRGTRKRYDAKPAHQHLVKIHGQSDASVLRLVSDGKITFDKVTDVFHSSTRHEENQPSHLLVADTNLCKTRCTEEFGNPCQHFCPAAVYEMVDGKEGRQLHLNPSNCVHCKTCDIMDPYQIITWVPPEGRGGPSYEGM